MKKKVRCENCDAVIDAEENRFYLSGWHYHYRCYQCNSVRTVETSEPYRLPKWERGLTTGAVDLLDSSAKSALVAEPANH